MQAQSDSPVLVHFGDSDFEAKYRTLLENIGQWRATTGRVESVDLRFNRKRSVNPGYRRLRRAHVRRRRRRPSRRR